MKPFMYVVNVSEFKNLDCSDYNSNILCLLGNVFTQLQMTDESSETVKHYFIECPLQSGPRENLFGILHNYTDAKSTSAILHIILQSVNIRDHNFKIIEAVSTYILESNEFT